MPSSDQQAYLTGLLYPPSTTDRVSRGIFLALGGGDKAGLDFPNFIQFASQLLRGSLTQRSQRLHILTSGHLDLLRETLHALLAKLCDTSSPTSPWAHSSPQCLASLVDFLTKPLGDVGVAGGRSLTVGEVESWLVSSVAVERILDVAFGTCLYNRTLTSSEDVPPEIAALVGHPVRVDEEEGGEKLDTQRVLVPLLIPHTTQRDPSPSSSLLSAAALLMINSFLPAEVRGQLYPLFLSSQHGKSFSTLCKGLVGSGPCLLVIRDSCGHVFGGFAAVSWQFGPQFTGSSECFLFSLHPNMAVYTVTGYNDHYMYLQQTAQTMPNGLGMGGQLEYCGLWMSAEFDSGHSKGRPHCTTYGSPSLSSSEDFSVDTVEVWHVGPPPPPPEQSDGVGQSILDKDKVAGHILEMAGKSRHSEGLRELPPDGGL
jgi:hypothetical protein